MQQANYGSFQEDWENRTDTEFWPKTNDYDEFSMPKNEYITEVVITYIQDNDNFDGSVEFIGALGCVKGVVLLFI